MNKKSLLFIFLLLSLTVILYLLLTPNISETSKVTELDNNNVNSTPIESESLASNLNKVLLGNKELQLENCSTEQFMAPVYVNNNGDLYIKSRHDGKTYIFLSKNVDNYTSCELVHTFNTSGNVVGLSNYIYWTEYTRQKEGIIWEIKKLNLKDDSVIKIDEGISKRGNEIPTLVSDNENVYWIEYHTLENEITESTLFKYNDKVGKQKIIIDQLHEKDGYNGNYLIYYSQNKNNSLVYKSTFLDGDKQFELLLNNDKTEKVVSNLTNLLDITINENYVALTGIDLVNVYKYDDLKLGALVYSVSGNKDSSVPSSEKTYDTPIFIDKNTLVYRIGMSEILLVDLKTNTEYKLNPNTTILSKPRFNNGFLVFAYKKEKQMVVRVLDFINR
ncbi:hypothetical protein CIB95_00195 [Lottiidibacillus patelloidae]|uniref:DUF5050 domain-containing protein n=1 Tax=Lottiidibacillus patelloidae TaxID=2670334 RepID=A0A263BWE9_9BACI|nr:hypothetical protein [Lottiidibacillus patelloidae]OZM58035.1 hypothetical protein CIB95_00195 [Lottiidibacillus patelloidae]